MLIDTLYVGWLQVDKPNIYLYPNSNIDLCVELNFPKGGRVVKSIPAIDNNSWCVHVDPTGKIDNNYHKNNKKLLFLWYTAKKHINSPKINFFVHAYNGIKKSFNNFQL